MQASCEALPEALAPVYDRLVGLRRRLQRMEQHRDHALQEVVPLQAQLDELDADRWEILVGTARVPTRVASRDLTSR